MVVGGYGRGQREQDKGLLSDSQELLGNQEINTFYFWWRSHEAPLTSLSFVFFFLLEQFLKSWDIRPFSKGKLQQCEKGDKSAHEPMNEKCCHHFVHSCLDFVHVCYSSA